MSGLGKFLTRSQKGDIVWTAQEFDHV